MSKINFGIMGAGYIARRFAAAVGQTEVAQVVAVASKTAEKARSFAEENGIPNAYSYEQLLADGQVDAVYVSTTNNFHYDCIKMCLEAGKHVLCEKPMVLKKAEGEELFALAESRGLFLMEAMWTCFLPAVQQARRWIAEGRIGKLQCMNFTTGFRIDTNPDARHMRADLAGGAIYDMGVYPIHVAAFLAGEEAKNVLSSVRRDSRTGVDTNSSFVISYDSCDAVIQALFAASPRSVALVTGSEGSIELPNAVNADWCRLYDGKGRLLEECRLPPKADGFVYEIEETARCINEGRLVSETVPPAATLNCAWVFEQLLG